MSVERLVANLARVAREDLDGARVLACANNRNDENPLEPALRDVEYLAAYATTYRYPTAAGRIKAAPAPEEIERAIERVASALEAVVAAFDIDLAQRDVPAAKSGPIR